MRRLTLSLFGAMLCGVLFGGTQNVTIEIDNLENVLVEHVAYSYLTINATYEDLDVSAGGSLVIRDTCGAIVVSTNATATSSNVLQAVTVAGNWATNLTEITRFYGDMRVDGYDNPLPWLVVDVRPAYNTGEESYVPPHVGEWQTNGVTIGTSDTISKVSIDDGLSGTVSGDTISIKSVGGTAVDQEARDGVASNALDIAENAANIASVSNTVDNLDLQAVTDIGATTDNQLTLSGGALMSTSAIEQVGSVFYDTTVEAVPEVGEHDWDATLGTFHYGMPYGDYVHETGLGQVTIARNNTGATILKGSCVYLGGSQGDQTLMALSDTYDPDTYDTIGLVVSGDVANNGTGLVCTGGRALIGDTSGFAAGNEVYMFTNGTLTASFPLAATSGVVRVGIVERSHANQGVIQVGIVPYVLAEAVNGSLRYTIRNTSDEAMALSLLTTMNDLGHRVTLGIGGSGFMLGSNLASLYNEGYADLAYVNDGPVDHVWFSNPDGIGDFGAYTNEIMRLDSDGNLGLPGGAVIGGGLNMSAGSITNVDTFYGPASGDINYDSPRGHVFTTDEDDLDFRVDDRRGVRFSAGGTNLWRVFHTDRTFEILEGTFSLPTGPAVNEIESAMTDNATALVTAAGIKAYGDANWSGGGASGTNGFVMASRSSTQSIPNGTTTTIIYNIETTDRLGEYNNSTGVFTASQDGTYTISASVVWSGTTANVYYRTQISTSNGLFSQDDYPGTAQTLFAQSSSYTTELSTGNTVSVRVYTTSGGGGTIYATGTTCNLTITKVQ